MVYNVKYHIKMEVRYFITLNILMLLVGGGSSSSEEGGSSSDESALIGKGPESVKGHVIGYNVPILPWQHYRKGNNI